MSGARVKVGPRVLPVSALVLSLLAADARADGGTILRVRSSKGALEDRLSAELSTLGFDVKDIEPTGPDEDLEQIARDNGAVAAVRVQGDETIEVWVSVPGEAEPATHQIVRIDPRRGWSSAAVSALEALRAHLLRVGRSAPPGPPPPIPRSPSPVPPPSTPLPRVPRLWLHLAGGAEASSGGLGVAAEVLGEVRFEPLHWFDVAAFGVVSPVSAQIEAPEGIASERHTIVGAAADAQTRLGAASASLGLGAVVGFFWLNARALSPGYAGQDASIVTAGPVLRSGASIDVTHALRARAELAGGITAPHAVIRFAGRQVADWGRPFGMITLGLEWGPL